MDLSEFPAALKLYPHLRSMTANERPIAAMTELREAMRRRTEDR